MWLAHTLTLLRLPLIAVMWVDRGWMAIAVGLAALTDTLDGRLARCARRSTAPPHPTWWAIGDWLDPVLDKLFVAGAIGALWFHVQPPLLVLALVGLRELMLVPLAAIYELTRRGKPHHGVRAEPIGKAATVAQFVALTAIALAAPALVIWILAYACAVLGVAAVAYYAWLVR